MSHRGRVAGTTPSDCNPTREFTYVSPAPPPRRGAVRSRQPKQWCTFARIAHRVCVCGTERTKDFVIAKQIRNNNRWKKSGAKAGSGKTIRWDGGEEEMTTKYSGHLNTNTDPGRLASCARWCIRGPCRVRAHKSDRRHTYRVRRGETSMSAAAASAAALSVREN